MFVLLCRELFHLETDLFPQTLASNGHCFSEIIRKCCRNKPKFTVKSRSNTTCTRPNYLRSKVPKKRVTLLNSSTSCVTSSLRISMRYKECFILRNVCLITLELYRCDFRRVKLFLRSICTTMPLCSESTSWSRYPGPSSEASPETGPH